VLITVGDGYALHLASDAVDLWRVERALRESVNAAPETADLLSRSAKSIVVDELESTPGLIQLFVFGRRRPMRPG